MEPLKKLFELLNRKQFLIQKCAINPDGGYNHRVNNNGTNEKSKVKSLTEDEIAKTKAGLISLIEDINHVIETL